jgi:hypothetical protein
MLLLLAAISLGHHWGPPVSWETDGLFYQAKTEQILGADATVARHRVFDGPLSSYERGIEAKEPDEPKRVSDPAWVEYSAPFYSRRLLLPVLAAALNPILGLNALETLSLLGFVLIPALLFWLLRQRLSLGVSAAVAAAVILWPPLRAWSVFPLSDSWGVALLCAALLCGLFAVERGWRWLVPWSLCVAGLALTRDDAFIPVLAALVLLAVRRDRRSLALAGCGLAAAIPTLAVHGVSISTDLNYIYANHSIPTETGWGAAISGYPSNLGHQAGRYLEYALANPHVVLAAIGGVAAAFALAPRRDPLTLLIWATFPGYLLLLAVGPAFSGFRYELVLLPLIAFGYAQLAERVACHVHEAREARVAGDAPLRLLKSRPSAVSIVRGGEK